MNIYIYLYLSSSPCLKIRVIASVALELYDIPKKNFDYSINRYHLFIIGKTRSAHFVLLTYCV